MTEARTYVLDAWPIVEWLLGKQPAAHKFTSFLNSNEQVGNRLLISRLNRGEILYTLAKRVSEPHRLTALEALQRLDLEVVSLDDDLVDNAIEIKTKFACSYADCFAVALAIRFAAPVVTGDREFLKLQEEGLVALEWMGA